LTTKASAPIAGDRITEAVVAAHAKHKKNRRGKNAAYIPALAEVDPQLFGVCVATVDGQTFRLATRDVNSRWNRSRRSSRPRSLWNK
jgi:glutaminase